MSVNLADELCQKYLNQLVREGQVFSLMDFFSDPKAKKALHRSDLQLEEVALNYQTRRPTSKSIREGVAEMLGSDRMRPVSPPKVMGSVSARFFSASSTDPDRDQAVLDAQLK